MTEMATVSVNMERYNEDEVGVSVWACPGGGRVVRCGPCLRLRVGVSSCSGGGVVGSAEGREEVVTHQLTAHTAHVHSTGGDKQEVLHVHTHARTGGVCVCMRACVRAWVWVCTCTTLMPLLNISLRVVHMVKYRDEIEVVK